MNQSEPVTRLNAALEGRYRIERQLGEGGMATVYLVRLTTALLIALVVGCQDGTPVEPAEDSFELTIEGAQIDLSVVDRSVLGDIGRLIGFETPLGNPPVLAAPLDPGEPPTYTPLETIVVLVYVTAWLYENGLLDDPSAISMVEHVVDAHVWLTLGIESNAVDSFNEFIQVVQGLVDDGLLSPGAGQFLIDCAQAAIDFPDEFATIRALVNDAWVRSLADRTPVGEDLQALLDLLSYSVWVELNLDKANGALASAQALVAAGGPLFNEAEFAVLDLFLGKKPNAVRPRYGRSRRMINSEVVMMGKSVRSSQFHVGGRVDCSGRGPTGDRCMFKIFGRISAVALGVFAVVFGDVGELSAQATTFTACRVPDVGAIYMIGVVGAPPACLEPSHVQFSWNQEGPPGPQGSEGLPGPPGMSGLEVVTSRVTVPPGGRVEPRLDCPAGRIAISTGYTRVSGTAAQNAAYFVWTNAVSGSQGRFEIESNNGAEDLIFDVQVVRVVIG